ncbi:response regulator [Azospirillum rugosum]|uniref:CheY-like chemotaxis protein n=1 Tax=Azospirillum rugosum TaxID=416170 RepID=A0ABS4SWH2_9PROT|nr:response regulator [Azospirillum rugosum]MBP2295735.1 CheY-like chemotaxis protein [Azospirillum rugosum]MDQ0529154.1 CheY-like chemotaxis protein [Azospirillum rugosum]
MLPLSRNPAIGAAMITVLLIDDDPLIRMAMEWLMADWGFHVVAAGSEEEATTKLAESVVPALMVVDWRLPGGRTGADAVGRIRSLFRRHIPAIVVTGEVPSRPMRAIEDAGCPVLQKPVSPATLKAAVTDALAGPRDS